MKRTNNIKHKKINNFFPQPMMNIQKINDYVPYNQRELLIRKIDQPLDRSASRTSNKTVNSNNRFLIRN